MQTQKVFKAGNSSVVAVPKKIAAELGIKPGQRVIVEKSPIGEAFLVRKADSKGSSKGVLIQEFKDWLDKVLKEDAEILDELEVR